MSNTASTHVSAVDAGTSSARETPGAVDAAPSVTDSQDSLVAPYALDHVNLHVRDMATSLRFYQGTLGLPAPSVLSQDSAGQPTFVELRAGQQLIFLRHRPDYVPPASPHARGLNHLCLLIQPTDADSLMASLRARGVPITGTRGHPDGPTFSVYVADPDGHGVELEQRK